MFIVLYISKVILAWETVMYEEAKAERHLPATILGTTDTFNKNCSF